MKGYIKIDRSILENETLRNAQTMYLFLFLALNANWGETADGLKPGQLYVSINDLKKHIGISKPTITDRLQALEQAQIITRELSGKKLKITINKFIKFGHDTGKKSAEYRNPFGH